MTTSFKNTLFDTPDVGFIDENRLSLYLDAEIKNAPNEEKAIYHQKVILQTLSFLTALACLKILDAPNTTEGKIAFFSCLGMAGIAFVRSKRQELEKQFSFFKNGLEKFLVKEVLNSEPKTLNFLINPTYSKRLKTISNHSKNINKIRLLTGISNLALATALMSHQIDFANTLLAGAIVLATGNVASYLYTKRSLKKIKKTLPQGVSIPSLNTQHIKE